MEGNRERHMNAPAGITMATSGLPRRNGYQTGDKRHPALGSSSSVCFLFLSFFQPNRLTLKRLSLSSTDLKEEAEQKKKKDSNRTKKETSKIFRKHEGGKKKKKKVEPDEMKPTLIMKINADQWAD